MVIILLITIFLISGCEVQETSKQRILESAKVTGVIDGDTIKIEGPKNGKTLTVRLLHINTAEKGEKCYKEAKEKLLEAKKSSIPDVVKIADYWLNGFDEKISKLEQIKASKK